jgi:hypothetical protein
MDPVHNASHVPEPHSGNTYEYVLTNWWSDEEMTLCRRSTSVASIPLPAVQEVPSQLTGRAMSLSLSIRARITRFLNGDILRLRRRC